VFATGHGIAGSEAVTGLRGVNKSSLTRGANYGLMVIWRVGGVALSRLSRRTSRGSPFSGSS
jgi:hypothetical protein